MGTITSIDISTPVMHISSGKFTASKNWKHKHMYHNGNFEIIILIKGTIYLQVDNERFTIHEKEVFSLPPYHHISGYKESPAGTQYFWFHFFAKPGGLKERKLNIHDNSEIESYFKQEQAVLPLQLKLTTTEKVFVLSTQILDVVKDHYFTPMPVDYLLTTLVIELSQNYLKSLVGTPVPEDEGRIDTIKEWIRANLSEKLKVSDVAEYFSLNPHYLVRIFKNQTGETVIQYINNLKLTKARELLVTTNLPIKQIAGMAFYPDEKRFMKSFKEKLTVTPTEFRRAYNKKFLDSSNFDPEVPITKNTPRYKERFN
jgi:AraC-like DNA-binding protein